MIPKDPRMRLSSSPVLMRKLGVRENWRHDLRAIVRMLN